MARIKIDPDQWMTAAIQKAFVDKSDERYDPGWHHPSSLVHPCLAHQQFNFIGATKERRPFILAYTSTVGTFIHETIQDLIRDHPLIDEMEDSCNIPEFRVRGRLDIIGRDPDGEPTIVDIKTVESIPSLPRPKDILQVLWYMKMKNVERGAILYVRRSSGLTKRYKFRWKDWEKEWERNKDLSQQIIQDTLKGIQSPKTPESRTYCVKDCPFFKQCEAYNAGDKSKWTPLVENTIRILQHDNTD